MRNLLRTVATVLIIVGTLVALLLTYGGLQALAVVLFLALPSLLVSALAAYLTTLTCRLACNRGWHLTWFFGLLGTVAAGAISGCVVWLGLTLQPGGWGKADLRPLFVWMCVSGTALGLLLAEAVVWHYRRKIRNAGCER
jgi:hypothetical protein